MISWTIPADATLTASSSESSSTSYGSSNSYSDSITFSYPTSLTAGSGLTLSSESGSTTRFYSSEYYYSASTGLNGITTASTIISTSSFSITGSLRYEFEGGGTAGGPGGSTFATSQSSSASGTQGYQGYNVATSTTEVYGAQATTTKSILSTTDELEDVIFNSYWTTGSTGDSGTSSVSFFTQNRTSSVAYDTEQTTTVATRTVVTTLTATQTAAERATVVQAEPTEVLYHIASPATTWNGYLVASDVATTATRVTLYPSYSTVAISVGLNGTATSSEVNTVASQSLSWLRTTQTAATVTNAGHNYLPNRTSTATAGKHTTATTSLAVTIFPAETITYVAALARTSQVTSYGTVPTVVQRQIGSLAYETTVSTSFSASRKVLVANSTTGSTTYSTQTSSSFVGSSETQSTAGTSASASANSYAGNQTVYGPAQVTLFSPAQPERSRFETYGAAIGSASGGWMTYGGVEWYVGGFSIGTDLVSRGTAYDGNGTNAVTLFPASYPQFSIESNTITIKSSGSTSSYEVGIDGAASTFELSDSVGHFGGGPLANGCTVVEVAGPGAYKDRVGKSTASFSGAATVLTQGQSAPFRIWQTVTNIAPLQLSSVRHGLTFTEARNSVALPPA